MDDLGEAPPLEIDPYTVLEIETTAAASEVRAAYRKLALRHHPDKALPEEKQIANAKFQEIAFAYAILSDERRRKRYDTTGNTSESLDIDDDDFNWSEFIRTQWFETVTSEKIGNFQTTYQGSDEEKRDVLAAYERFKGNLNKIFNEVMLSNPLSDEDRFRRYINDAIEAKEVSAYDDFVHEPESKQKARLKRAKREAQEAEKHAKDLGLNGGKKSGKRGGAGNGEADLMQMMQIVQQRQKDRAMTFLDNLEAKYAAPQRGKAKAQNGKKRPADEPPEEAFERTSAKAKKQKQKRQAQVVEQEEEDEEEESELDDFVSDEEEEEEEEEEEDEDEVPKKRKGNKKKKPITVAKKSKVRQKR